MELFKKLVTHTFPVKFIVNFVGFDVSPKSTNIWLETKLVGDILWRGFNFNEIMLHRFEAHEREHAVNAHYGIIDNGFQNEFTRLRYLISFCHYHSALYTNLV